MSATLRIYNAASLTLSGLITPLGSVQNPVREVTIESGKAVYYREILLAADEKAVVWEWDDTDGFEYLAIIPLEEAYIRGAHRIDPVTSESDQTPTGSSGPWNHWSCSCFAWKEFDSDRAYFNATGATHVGSSGGLPGIWTSDGSAGVISAVALWNTDATAKRVGVLAIQ